MSNSIDASTTFSIATMPIMPIMPMMALFAALAASACDVADEPGSLAATEDAERAGQGDALGTHDRLDRLDAPDVQEAPPPAGFYIEKVTTLGKGCPDPASVTILMSKAKTGMRIIYHDMVLKRPPGGKLQTTNCQAVLSLRIPAGYKVAPASLTTRGFADLDQKIKARRHTNVFFAGVPKGVDFDTNLVGPYNDIYQANEAISADDLTWSPCGGSALLGINNSLVLNTTANPDGGAFINLYSQRLVSWQFKKC